MLKGALDEGKKMIIRMLRKLINLANRAKEKLRIKRQIARLEFQRIPPKKGTADWLAICELKMGGIQTNVKRLKVSDLDPRSSTQLQTGGMIGGDRMIHHNYAKIYEKYLDKFLSKSDCPTLIECGILRGTGLAVWSELFPDSLLLGLDIDLSHTQSNLELLKSRGAFQNNNPILLEFDQFKPDTTNLIKALGQQKIDIIIDDGFHSDETILNTFSALQPLFSDDFVYFAEDNSTVYPKLKARFPEYSIASYGLMTVISCGL